MRWARHFAHGRVVLTGTLGPLTLGPDAELAGPDARVAFTFVGGDEPMLQELTLRASGRVLRATAGHCVLDGRPVGQPWRLGALLEHVVDHLGDARVQGTAHPSRPVRVQCGAGIEVSLTGRDEVVVEAAAAGPADGLRLARPLVVSVGGDGILIGHRAVSLEVRISKATLHPDGRVDLQSTTRNALDRFLHRGLRVAAHSLSLWVQASPQFARVRAVTA